MMQETTTTRAEHLAWCKKRALEYVDAGREGEAFASMSSDLGKHPETAKHIGLEIGMMLMMSGHLKGQELRRWITGFN
jgi:hypothetical protein